MLKLERGSMKENVTTTTAVDFLETVGLNEIATMVHCNAIEKGFWDVVDYQKFLGLVISEKGEAIEARREERYSNYVEYENSELGFLDSYENHIKNTYQDEIADIYIRILDLCGHFGINIESREPYKNLIPNTNDIYANLNLVSYYISRISHHEIVKGELKPFLIEIEFVKSLMVVERLAELSGINLAWHVSNKMAYNAQREYKHGKKF